MSSFMPGSLFLQSSFYGLAAVIVAGATILLYRASMACGDSPDVARTNQSRFFVWALAWVAAVSLALGLVLAVRQVPRWVVQAWNVLGLVLLANILGVAMLSTPVFAYFGPDRLNVFVMRMPYTLLPAVMVLAAWAGHLIVFRALRQAR